MCYMECHGCRKGVPEAVPWKYARNGSVCYFKISRPQAVSFTIIDRPEVVAQACVVVVSVGSRFA